MSKKRRDTDYLSDIQEAIKRIIAYTENLTGDAFMEDLKTQDAVTRNLEVMGEATKNLSSPLRKRYPQIPWKDLAGVRDKLIHHYFGINYEIVWKIVEEQLPVLQPQIEEVLVKETEGTSPTAIGRKCKPA
ncbi:DUF86 domain-containing protein [Candidatus Poribacteria bacterium]|nr:DUF86 domain-containing protein [Candidatus Poribacteria bacterium]